WPPAHGGLSRRSFDPFQPDVDPAGVVAGPTHPAILARMAEPPAADLALGAFTANGPWVLDPDEITWLPLARRLRADVARRLPDLTRPRRLPPGLRVVTTVRHLGAAVALWALTERR